MSERQALPVNDRYSLPHSGRPPRRSGTTPPGGDPDAGTKREILSTREAAGLAYRMLYIDPMLVRFRARRLRDHAVRRRRSRGGPCSRRRTGRGVRDAPRRSRSVCPPSSRRRAVGRAVAPLRSQDRPAASPRRQHCRKPCACLSRHCDREFGDRAGIVGGLALAEPPSPQAWPIRAIDVAFQSPLRHYPRRIREIAVNGRTAGRGS